MLDLLKENKYEWIFWLGCDAEYKLRNKARRFIDNDYHFMIAYDYNNGAIHF